MKPALHCVLFDLDGVLADYDKQTRIEHLAHAIGRTAEAVHAAIYMSGIEEAGDSGALDTAGYLDALSTYLRCPVTAADWVAARRAATRIRPEVLDIAYAVASRIPVALLTNNGQLMADTLPQIVPALFPLFAGRAFAAAQFGAAKPEAAAFLGCLERLRTTPAATFFIDDSIANVEGARRAGLHAHHYQSLEDMKQALAEFDLP
ncbi:putative hydrolase of the HAD superfamily [Dyella sp. OK004]|uniref:HAD-IA family hydrolase n=1 Tax=Dyella sp. OK004 TaxID=1855292 RepID=UPI0008EA2255|nr:HAD-IA family hydrolase [Dyella sp. OK004]SFS17952.1 putative hydrolase of the HAD superfamily [Dyella sp. OK004]